LWPRQTLPDFFSAWEPDSQVLRVMSPGMSLFALGKTTTLSYRIQVNLSQTPWTGGAGIFIGYRQLGAGPDEPFRCQLFRLHKSQRNPDYSIEREILAIRYNPMTRRVVSDVIGVSRSPIPPPAAREDHLLDIQVKFGRVDTVHWNGQPLPELVNPDYDARVNAEDQTGLFGVYTGHTNCLFQDARFKDLVKEGR
jgi:hypothetical protein